MNNSEDQYLLTPSLPISLTEINEAWKKLRQKSRLLILVDRQGSMTPFSLLIKAIINSLSQEKLSDRTCFYYFHDCPEDFFYRDSHLFDAVPTAFVLDKQAKESSVLIISDAGSARGFYDQERVANTKLFIEIISRYTSRYVWLNPMPKNRWQRTTAEDIANMISMFPLNCEGLNYAVNIL
jgi:uncharacterized protein